MKYIILSLLLPLTAAGAGKAGAPAKKTTSGKDSQLITCQIKDSSACTSCEERIPASCENHAFNGSLETKTKPQKIQWLVSDSKSGTEKVITTDNKGWTLKDLKNGPGLKTLAEKANVKMGSNETVTLMAVQVPTKTAMYLGQTGQGLIAQIKPQSNLRNVASAQQPMAGGAKRAQQVQKQK